MKQKVDRKLLLTTLYRNTLVILLNYYAYDLFLECARAFVICSQSYNSVIINRKGNKSEIQIRNYIRIIQLYIPSLSLSSYMKQT